MTKPPRQTYSAQMEVMGNPEKPAWIRVKAPSGETWRRLEAIIDRRALHTVCDAAQCPNKAECWEAGTATFMILGAVCTRSCRFCAVESARTGQPLRVDEADALAEAIAELGLRYVVLTSVDRDDLADRGSAHFAECVRTIRARHPDIHVEVLVPDYTEAELRPIVAAGCAVVAHNLETVRRLQFVRDARAGFDTSLSTLAAAKRLGATTKSSLLLGLGEDPAEVHQTMDELRRVGVDILVLGQYLRPSKKQIPVAVYLPPETFLEYERAGLERGFSSVVAAPFARTSYHAASAWLSRTSSPTSRPSPRLKIKAIGKPSGSKLIRLEAEIADGRIKRLDIRGDFFAVPEEGFETVTENLNDVPVADLAERFDADMAAAAVSLYGISGAAVAEILQGAINDAAL